MTQHMLKIEERAALHILQNAIEYLRKVQSNTQWGHHGYELAGPRMGDSKAASTLGARKILWEKIHEIKRQAETA